MPLLDLLNLRNDLPLGPFCAIQVEFECHSAQIGYIEGDLLGMVYYVNHRFLSCMSNREFIKNVWVMIGKVSNDKIGFKNSFKYLKSNAARLRYFVRPDNCVPEWF